MGPGWKSKGFGASKDGVQLGTIQEKADDINTKYNIGLVKRDEATDLISKDHLKKETF